MSSPNKLQYVTGFEYSVDPSLVNYYKNYPGTPIYQQGSGDPATGFPIAIPGGGKPLGSAAIPAGGLPPDIHATNYIDTTSLAVGNYDLPLILDQIFKLLTRMISSLQNVTAAQANRLTFLTNWQNVYTDSLNQIVAFTQKNPAQSSLVSGSVTDSDHHRQDLNQTNSTYTQTLQGYRNTISDAAKALQSNVNQSNNDVNNEANMATSIIQEFQTILTSIFSGAS